MKLHAWPDGTRKQVKVLHSERIQWRRRMVAIVATIEEATGQDFVLMRGGSQTARPGDRATIIYTRGGPSGGYWKYQPQTQASPS